MAVIVLLALLALTSTNYGSPEPSKIILDKVFEIIDPASSKQCTLVGITTDDTEITFWRAIEETFVTGTLNTRIIINFKAKGYNRNLTNLSPMKSQHSEACSFVFHFQEREPWADFHLNFVKSLPGGIFRSYHLAFTEHPTSGYFQHNVPLPLTQMHNFLLVRSQEPQTFEILTPNVWFNGSQALASYQNGSWYDETLDLFRSKWQDYGGGPLTVATTPDITKPELEAILSTGIHTRYVLANMIELTRYVNTTPRLLNVFPGNYGRQDGAGNWVGLIAEVWKGRAHFSFPVAISRERTQIVSYSKIFALDGVIFVTGLPVHVNPGGSLAFIIAPFTALVWLGCIGSFCLLCGSLLLKKRLEEGMAASESLEAGIAASKAGMEGKTAASRAELKCGIAASKPALNGDTAVSESGLKGKIAASTAGLESNFAASKAGFEGKTAASRAELKGRIAVSKPAQNGDTAVSEEGLKGKIAASKTGSNGLITAFKARGSVYSKYLGLSILNLLLRPTIEQSADTPNLIRRVLKDSTSRFLFGTWLLAIIVLNSGYKSKIISALLSPQMASAPKTYQELSRSKYRIGAVLYNESFYGESFRHLNNEVGRVVAERAKGYSNVYASRECFVLSETTDHVCMGMTAILIVLANLFMTDSNGQIQYKTSTDALFPFGAGTAVPAHFPHLLEPFNRMMGRLEDQGITKYWIEKEQDLNRVKGQRLAVRFRKRSETKKGNRSGQEISRLLVVLLAGHVLALCVFLCECIVHVVVKRCYR